MAGALGCSILAAASLVGANAFYLPGVAPRDYAVLEPVDVFVNALDSVQTQIPYEYYDLPFCKPYGEKVEEKAESLGQVVSGDVIETSPFTVLMDTTESCKLMCDQAYSKKDLDLFAERVKEEYRVHLIADNMPSMQRFEVVDMNGNPILDENGNEHFMYEKGSPLGFVGGPAYKNSKTGQAYIYNHLRLHIMYHQNDQMPDGYRVVGFEVEPYSVDHQVDGKLVGALTKLKTCNDKTPIVNSDRPLALTLAKGEKTKHIVWSYDVVWDQSDVRWASRWDAYLRMDNASIHWNNILASFVVVIVLSGMVAVVMTNTLYKDLQAYNAVNLEEDVEETGWKLIHGEVFRAPSHPAMYCVLVGSGLQLGIMTVATLVFALFGFTSPAKRGSLVSAFLLMFVLMGSVAGYTSTRIFKTFQLVHWKRNTLITALFMPGLVFAVFFVLNLALWAEKSSGAVPFVTFLALLALWFGVSVPMVYLGSYVAFNKPAIEHPVKVNNIPRMLLPSNSVLQSQTFSVAVGGIIVFTCLSTEMYFVMTSVWKHQFLYIFPILMALFLMLVIICAELGIVMTYFQLCSENYHWWWRSFFTTGSAAGYMFVYSIVYFATELDVTGFVPSLLYFGYMALASFCLLLVAGTIGTLASWSFVSAIYGSVKID